MSKQRLLVTISLAALSLRATPVFAGGVTYYEEDNGEAAGCKFVAELTGHPGFLSGGLIGKAQARKKIRKRAARMGINVLIESDSNWASGDVTASGYSCKGKKLGDSGD